MEENSKLRERPIRHKIFAALILNTNFHHNLNISNYKYFNTVVFLVSIRYLCLISGCGTWTPAGIRHNPIPQEQCTSTSGHAFRCTPVDLVAAEAHISTD